MNGRFDKIAPGLAAKLNLLTDLLLGLLILVHAADLDSSLPLGHLATLGAVLVLVWVFAAALLRLYSPCSPRTKADTLMLGIVATVAVALGVAATQTLLWQSAEAPVAPVRFGLTFASVAAVTRLLFAILRRHIETEKEKVLIVGTGPHAAAAYAALTGGAGERRHVVGFLRFRGQPQMIDQAEAPVLGDADDLLKMLSTHPVAEVYLAAPLVTFAAQMQQIVRVCEDIGMPFALPLHFLRLERARLLAPVATSDGFLHYQSTRLSPGRCAVKRLFDIIASTVALTLLSPLLLSVALAIKLTSLGPVLFKQIRVGLHGATFNLFKFRSMVVNAEELQRELLALNEQTGPVFKIRRDPRVTPVGRFIRRFSIDELPQLINILRGDMTIVGPRPALPNEVAQYKTWQRRRLSVRPGLTCLWQVGGRNTVGFEDWMRLDLQYVDTWSLALDLRLILRTLPVVLAGKGAS